MGVRKPRPRGRKARQWTAKERQLVLNMSQNGCSLRQIGKALGVSEPTVRRHFRAELKGGTRTPGASEKDWTETERNAVLAMASYGIPYTEIAQCFGVNRMTIASHFGDELENVKTRLHANIARSLIRSATVDRNVQAQIFLAKTRLGWTEKVHLDHGGSIDTGVPDVDLESAVESLSVDGRKALRQLLAEASASQAADEAASVGVDDDAPASSGRLH